MHVSDERLAVSGTEGRAVRYVTNGESRKMTVVDVRSALTGSSPPIIDTRVRRQYQPLGAVAVLKLECVDLNRKVDRSEQG